MKLITLKGWKSVPRFACLLAMLIALASFSMRAEDLSEAEVQGHLLVNRLLDQRPATNYEATGTLSIRDARHRTIELPLEFKTIVTETNWENIYQAGSNNQIFCLTVIHADDQPDACYYSTNHELGGIPILGHLFQSHKLTGENMMTAFAGSDFWIVDLGLEFLHWPQQKVLKKEIKRSQGCTVLESINPHPAARGYARVVSWIDSESGGIVQAKAYDADDQLLKEFYPEDFKKANGQWQVTMMEMDNDQTKSRSQLKFNPPPADSPKK